MTGAKSLVQQSQAIGERGAKGFSGEVLIEGEGGRIRGGAFMDRVEDVGRAKGVGSLNHGETE